MRLTGGQLSGRKLRSPPSGVRPTSDRVREAIFARLSDLEGAAVLDVYSGTGALGFEALSRGAESLVCVERAARSLAALRANAADLGLTDRVTVVAGDAVRGLRRLAASGARFHLVLMDPPYASEEVSRALAALRDLGLLAEGGTVVIERGRRHSLPHVEGWDPLDERRYGDTVVSRLEATPEQAPDPERSGEEGALAARRGEKTRP